MSSRFKKVILLVLAIALLAGVSQVQRSLNVDRDRLGLTRVTPLENAPPVLAFTTVALGGFRGLISNALWIRANDLQEQDKFFEAVQLADWITKLEPHFPHVWLYAAWNMTYNISVKFKDFADRWRWVQGGIHLLRDEGLRYNPNETLLYRELAWFFQHKLGANLDDANVYYKQAWASEMARVFGKKAPDLNELINAQSDDAKQRLAILTNEFKMDPKLMKELDARYGPLEWRLPEAHAIYWAAKGLEAAEKNPAKVNADDLITLRRVIYQSMQLSFQRGRLIVDPFAKRPGSGDRRFEFGPNLDIIPKVYEAYEEAAREDAKNRDHIKRAERNFLRDAVYFLYGNNRMKDAARWYKVIGEIFPDNNLLNANTNSLPRNLTLDDYALDRLQEELGDTSLDRTKAVVEGLLAQRFQNLILDEDERAEALRLMAIKVHDRFERETASRKEALPLAPIAEMEREILNRLLNPETGFNAEVRARLRTKLGLPAEALQTGTNAIPHAAGLPATNSVPPTNNTGK